MADWTVFLTAAAGQLAVAALILVLGLWRPHVESRRLTVDRIRARIEFSETNIRRSDRAGSTRRSLPERGRHRAESFAAFQPAAWGRGDRVGWQLHYGRNRRGGG